MSEVRVKRVYRVKKDTNEKILVGYLGDATLDKVRNMSPDINEEEYHPTWYYEYSVNPGKLVKFIPEHLKRK